MKYLYLFSFIVFSFSSSAQNWKTVSDKDTVFFSAGKHSAGQLAYLDSNFLRQTYIISSEKVNTDSIFHFFTGLRTDGYNQCMDTLAPSWLGPCFVRKPDGTEYYFNSMGDTIAIKTFAGLNASWILAHDTLGNTFKATLTAVDYLPVDDNIYDSVKTISIQAYDINNAPITHYYNNLVLQFSLNHGWVKALEMYRFPNSISNWDRIGTVIDSTQHYRLPSSFSNADIGKMDLAWKYAPGNEWIFRAEGWYTYHENMSIKVTHDSVMSATIFSGDTAIVTLKTDLYIRTPHFHQGPPVNYWDYTDSTATYTHTDTIYNTPSASIKAAIRPEYLDTLMYGFGSADLNIRYFIDSFCTNNYLLRSHETTAAHFEYDDSCWIVGVGLSGYEAKDKTVLPRFGNIYNHQDGGEVAMEYSRSQYYQYLRLNGCIFGTEINVLTLDAGSLDKQAVSSVYPNPVKDKLFVNTGTSLNAVISLCDITGRQLLQVNATNNITELPVKGYVPGLYVLSVRAAAQLQTYKVLIIE